MFNLLFLDVTLPLSDLSEVGRLGLGCRLAISVILLIVGGSNGFIVIASGRPNIAFPLVTDGVETSALTLTLALVASIFLSRHSLIHLREVVVVCDRLINE